MASRWRVRLRGWKIFAEDIFQNPRSKIFDFPKSPKNHIFGRFGKMKIFDPKNFPKNLHLKNNLVFGAEPKILRLVFFGSKFFQKVYQGKSINQTLSRRRSDTRIEIVTDFWKFPIHHDHFFTNDFQTNLQSNAFLWKRQTASRLNTVSLTYKTNSDSRLTLFVPLSQQCLFTRTNQVNTVTLRRFGGGKKPSWEG